MVSIYLLDQFLHLRLLHVLLPSNHLKLEPVDIHIMQLVSIYLLDRFHQLRLCHAILLSNHLKLEPVDIHIIQLVRILLVLFNRFT